MIENKCSLTRFAVAAASSNENFFFNLCVKSVETAYGRATKDFEWKNQKKYELFGQCLFKGTQWGCGGGGSETKERPKQEQRAVH